MRLSKLFFRTVKEASHDDIISLRYLERGGYLKKLGKGLYSYTPLMWRVIQKLCAIMREELNKVGCQEVSLPLLHPKEIWEQTGRYDDFKSANLLYTLTDREGHEFCLSPTHEEVIVSLVSHWATSHKQLPLNLYQIGPKFRDEIRPRFGLMRGKEFLMKDGYSFSSSEEGMEEQYRLMHQAYSAIFKRLGLDFAVVQAHGGKIGKGKSEEFQVKAEVGEDLIMVAGSYAANIETAQSIIPSFYYETDQKRLEKIETPHISSIEDLSRFLKVPPQRILKTLIYKFIYADREEFAAIGIRGDRQVNEVKVLTHFGAFEIVPASEEEIKKITGSRPGFAGPLHIKIPFLADLSAQPLTNFVTAGNIEDVHFINVNWGRDMPQPQFFDFLLSEEGDICPQTNEPYKKWRGIEVGHIFNLGTNYSEKMGAFFQDVEGKMRPFVMGTYGIGVGRTAQACIEQKHDAKGIIWPLSIAPYRFFITAANMSDSNQVHMAEKIYTALSPCEPLLDDRDERMGFKLKDSDLLGIPYKIVIGKTFTESGKIEVESRQGEKQHYSFDELLNWAQKMSF